MSLLKYILITWLIFFKVDGAEESSKAGENKATSKFQSIGVQVEEEKWWVKVNAVFLK